METRTRAAKGRDTATGRNNLYMVEEGLCYGFLALLALLPAAEAAARLIFRTGIPASSAFIVQFLLVAGLLCGMICTRKGEHLSIAIADRFFTGRARQAFAAASGLLSTFVCTVIAWCGAAFTRVALYPWKMIAFIPDQFFGFIIPIGFAVMAIRFARRTPLRGALRALPILAIVLGTACSAPVIGKLIYGINAPDTIYELQYRFQDLAAALRAPLFVFFIIAALGGAPLFVVIGGLAITLIQAEGGEIDVAANQIYSGLTESSFIAIPLFTLVGFFLSESKAGERLVRTFRSLFAWFPGGMIVAAVLICAFFTSFTGASGVTILALGGLLFTILSGHVKYPEKFSIGLLTSVGSIGLLFPPSVPIILVGAKTQTNIIHVFLGGIIPGCMLVLAVIVFGIITSVKVKIPVEPFSGAKALASLKAAAFEILLPILLIAGYFSGILSLVEIGAAALIYVFIVEVFVHKDIPLAQTPNVFAKAVPIIGGVLSILALSQALSYYIVDTQVPDRLAEWMVGAIKSRWVFLLLLNLALLAVGCLMDIFSAILVVLPLVAPLGAAYGIDPVHLGIIFITNLEVGFLTPPVGMNLFLATYRFKRSFLDICRCVLPFLLIQLLVVLLVTYVPGLSTFLPGLFK